MRKFVGILTEDFRLYHDLVAELKARDIPFVSLSFSDRVPQKVGAIITSETEASKVKFRAKVATGNVEDAIARALQLLKGRSSWREVIIGIDPGPHPGMAVIADGEVVDTRIASAPEEAADIVAREMKNFPARKYIVRVGHADRTNRNRIINALSETGYSIEIVDESGTTRRTEKPDIDAAIGIGLASGIRAAKKYEIQPTPGEVREIQRQSRILSGGRVTISKDMAVKVAQGRLSLKDAIDQSLV